MNAFIKLVLFSSVFGMFLFSGCGDDNPTGPATPEGTWKGTVKTTTTMTASLKSDKTFSMKISMPLTDGTITVYDLTGTWTRSGDSITFTGASGLMDNFGIPPPSVNPFTATISGNQMTLGVPYATDSKTIVLTKE
jgi:hypothetical protein